MNIESIGEKSPLLLAACLLGLVVILISAGCTLDEGQPWGTVEAELQVASPPVGEAFEVESFELEVRTVRLITTSAASGGGGEFDPQNPPAGCSLCHGGHCHCDGELVSYEDLRRQVGSGTASSRQTVANLTPSEPITAAGALRLGEASVAERTSVDTVEVELAGLRVDGTLTRGNEQIPTTLSLPGIGGVTLSAPADLVFGPDAPEFQQILVTLDWSDGWLDAIDVDELETNGDGEILIASTANRDQAELIAGKVAESSIQVEVPAH